MGSTKNGLSWHLKEGERHYRSSELFDWAMLFTLHFFCLLSEMFQIISFMLVQHCFSVFFLMIIQVRSCYLRIFSFATNHLISCLPATFESTQASVSSVVSPLHVKVKIALFLKTLALFFLFVFPNCSLAMTDY